MSGDGDDPLLQVLDALVDLGVPHHVGGSYASAFHGVPRQTRDADLVVDLDSSTAKALAARLRPFFYLDEERMLQAVRRRSSVNLIHLGTSFKIDLFIKGDGSFDQSEFERSQFGELPGSAGRTVAVKSAEDTILRKLAWYAEGGGISDRQWSDVLGILKVQQGNLDIDYLKHWAGVLDVASLLDRALAEA